MLRELLTCSILISVVGCSSVPKEDNSSILMEDVIVEKTTVRSTTQNPKPKSNGGVYISGDNINIGTLIVNSPGAVVDNSTKVVSVHQSQTNQSNHQSHSSTPLTSQSSSSILVSREPDNNQPAYDTERDFFKKVIPAFSMALPSILIQSFAR